MIEVAWVDEWLYGVLVNDAQLSALVGGRIFSYVAPLTATTPFVVFNHQAGTDVRGVGTVRVMTSLVYQVKVVGQGESVRSLKPIADRIDALLHGASGSVADGTVLTCVREQQVAYAEVDEGVRYNHLGGLWRILAR